MNKSLNIAMISYYLPSGSKIGAGYMGHYMANAMVRRGHRVTVFSPCPKADDALYELKHVDVGKKFRTFQFAWKLRKMGLYDFDVIHGHGDDYWLWGRDKPVHVRTMHGSCLAEAMHVPRLKEKLRMLILGVSEILATHVADRTMCVSQNTLDYYRSANGVIYNGVDLSSFRPTEQKEEQPTILFVGTYQNRKRGKLLMEAFEREIRPAVPNAKLKMVCGDAPEAEGVEVMGYVSTEELCALYREAWVFCLPSSYEGFGVPYIEAMASGTPVVATPNVGACEVLGDGKFGVLAEPEELGSTLRDLLLDDQARERWQEVGLERSKEFGWDRIVSQYEAVYAEVAESRSRHQGESD